MNEQDDITESRQSAKLGPQLPGLSCLRSFVLAIEEGSFSRAAEALGVTHAAVIQHVKGLEKQVGFPLLVRGGRVLKATSSGAELYLRIKDSVRLLEHAFIPEQHEAATRIRISTVPAFANGWLIPNLAAIRRSFPGVEFRLDVNLAVEDMGQSGTDIAIRMGDGNWQDGSSRVLLADTAYPVASPSSPGALLASNPEDLLRLPLIENPLLPWSKWFASNGVDDRAAKHVLTVCDSYSAQLAAENGLGICLARASLAADGVRQGRLLHVLPSSVGVDATWWITLNRLRRRNQRLATAVVDAIIERGRVADLPRSSAAALLDAPRRRLGCA